MLFDADHAGGVLVHDDVAVFQELLGRAAFLLAQDDGADVESGLLADSASLVRLNLELLEKSTLCGALGTRSPPLGSAESCNQSGQEVSSRSIPERPDRKSERGLILCTSEAKKRWKSETEIPGHSRFPVVSSAVPSSIVVPLSYFHGTENMEGERYQ